MIPHGLKHDASIVSSQSICEKVLLHNDYEKRMQLPLQPTKSTSQLQRKLHPPSLPETSSTSRRRRQLDRQTQALSQVLPQQDMARKTNIVRSSISVGWKGGAKSFRCYVGASSTSSQLPPCPSPLIAIHSRRDMACASIWYIVK